MSQIIKPGIYRQNTGKLYFVSGVSCHRSSREKLVSYYPLYPSSRRQLHCQLDEFFEVSETGRYPGARFLKIRDWGSFDILPGTKFNSRSLSSIGPMVMCTVQKVTIKRKKIHIVTHIGHKGVQLISAEVFMLLDKQFVF